LLLLLLVLQLLGQSVLVARGCAALLLLVWLLMRPQIPTCLRLSLRMLQARFDVAAGCVSLSSNRIDLLLMLLGAVVAEQAQAPCAPGHPNSCIYAIQAT
jgi:hypothetical protein